MKQKPTQLNDFDDQLEEDYDKSYQSSYGSSDNSNVDYGEKDFTEEKFNSFNRPVLTNSPSKLFKTKKPAKNKRIAKTQNTKIPRLVSTSQKSKTISSNNRTSKSITSTTVSSTNEASRKEESMFQEYASLVAKDRSMVDQSDSKKAQIERRRTGNREIKNEQTWYSTNYLLIGFGVLALIGLAFVGIMCFARTSKYISLFVAC